MAKMRVYLLSLGAGLLVGVVYSLLNVRSPAPPVVALVGLFGILIGEQIMPVARHAAHLRPPARAPRACNARQDWLRTGSAHMTQPARCC
jgi:XapX domain-containing protein